MGNDNQTLWRENSIQQDCALYQQRPKSQPEVIRLWIQISRYGTRCLPDSSKHVVDPLLCRHQSFQRVLWKLGGDSMRSANKSQKMPYSAVVREAESDPESVSGTGSPPKVNQFFRSVGPIITSRFNESRSDRFCSNPSDSRDRTTDQQTDDCITSALVEIHKLNTLTRWQHKYSLQASSD